MKLTHKYLLLLTSVAISVTNIWGQTSTYDPSVFIETDINVGNPAFPFPQFLEYPGGGKSLARYNAEGVTHADMEKSMREAYEIMMHRARYMGGTHCGVRYITFNHDDVPGNYGTFVSEGDGYALLAAAIFADQKTFNGLYMWIHDNRMSGVKRFKDGSVLRITEPDFAGPYLAGWKNDETTPDMSPSHSATDGDVDIAMAMLIAYKQWGEWMMQDGQVVKDYAGNPISLKQQAFRVVSALVDTIPQWDSGSGQISGYISGDIGIDGYCKKGNSWGELTRWRFSAEAEARYPGLNGPYGGGPNLLSQYGTLWIDYDAPAYFDEFYRWFKSGEAEDGNKTTDWQIHQFQRAAASGNYLNREAYQQGYIASIGNVTIGDKGENPQFNVYVDGEDFRYAWRHLVDYLWHGHQQYDWDPVTHQVIEGTNTSEYDMAIRHAEMLKNPKDGGKLICNKMGASPDPGQPKWFGVSQIPQQWRFDGSIMAAYHTNYSVGSGSPAAVISEDLELLADIYRQCEISWDGNNTAAKLDPEERYIGSTPKYFHGWFRTLGMLVCSGNYHAPEIMKPAANMKVYMDVDKTYAYQGDKITYKVDYRNYGSLDAEGVTITTELDPNYEFVSATHGGKLIGNKIVWNIGSVPGFKTGGLDATRDSVHFTVIAADTLNPRICLTSTISGKNFDKWTSNEFPNNATYTMERNCVDILANRSLFIEKTANRTKLNPNDVATFTVKFGNKSEGESSWMNGGRDHVRLSYGTYQMDPTYQFYSLYRFWNDSYEAYINMNNYRVSYFMYDAAATGLVSSENPTGWTFVVDNQNDLDKYGYNPATGPITFSYQKIPQGEDQYGKWNQRLMIRFADVLMAPSTHVYDKLDSQYLLHKGVWGPGFIRARLASNPNADLSKRLLDDWSYDKSVAAKTLDGQGETFTLISPGWANYDNPGYIIDNYTRHTCDPESTTNFGRVLVEEFDGYTWRRIQGTGPLPGREAYNVTICDTIPYELEWVGWVDSTALKSESGEKIKATYTPAANPKGSGFTGIVKWTIPTMLVGEEDKLVYRVKARDLGCPEAEDKYYMNVAWIWSDTDSPDSSRVELMTTCTELPPQIEPQTSLFKTASVKNAEVGDVVSYEVKQKNTEGTLVDADCKSTKNWIALGAGTLPAVSSEGLALSTNGQSAYFFAPEKSYGIDGEVFCTIGGSPSSTQALYIVFRYEGGTPGKPDFKGICMQMMVNKDGKNNFGYILYNNGTEIKSEGLSWADAMQFPGNSDAPTFKFVLKGDHLYMYVNDEDDEWTNVSKDWEGLTAAGPGYCGMYVNSNGNSSTQLTSFKTQFDYAFDLTIYDQLPEELGKIDNISDKGVYDKAKHTITWPTIATTVKDAIAPGDSIIRTFDAEVIDCDKFINNLGLATVYGMDTLKVLNTISCGKTTCEIEMATAKLADTEICEGDSTSIKVTAKPVKPTTGSYIYEFYLDDSLIYSGKKDSTIVLSAGKYTAFVRNADDTTCYAKSKPVALTVNPRPEKPAVPEDIEINKSDVCIYLTDIKELDFKKEATDIVYWLDGTSASKAAPCHDAATEDKTGKDYGVFIENEFGCVSDTALFNIKINSADKPKMRDTVICAGQEIADLSTLVTEEAGYDLIWFEDETAATGSDVAPVLSAADSKPGIKEYFVARKDQKGAVSEKSKITVTIAGVDKPAIKEKTIDYCAGDNAASLSDNVVLAKDSTSFLFADGLVWYTNGKEESTEPMVDASPKKTTPFKYAVGQTYEIESSGEICKGDTIGFTVTVTVMETPATKTVVYVSSDLVNGKFSKNILEQDTNAVTKTDSSYDLVWFDSDMNPITGTPTPACDQNKVDAGKDQILTYYVRQTNGKCESDTVKVKVIISSTPMPITENLNFCEDEVPAITIADLVKVNTAGGTQESDFELVWVSSPDSDTPETEPVLNTTLKDTTSVVETTTYYVKQKNKNNGSISSAAEIVVSVYAKPRIESTDIAPSCETSIDLKSAWTVANVKYEAWTYALDGKNINMNSVSESGDYEVKASFKVKAPGAQATCESETKIVSVRIDKLSDVAITGPVTACPNSAISLKADYKVGPGIKPEDIKFSWTGNFTSGINDAEAQTSPLIGTAGDTHTFNLEVTAGACKKSAEEHVVTIGDGSVSGSVIFSENNNTVLNGKPVSVNKKTIEIYTCGEELTIDASGIDHTANDFEWSIDGVASGAGAVNKVSPTEKTTYRLSYTNECATFIDFVVIPVPITLTPLVTGNGICEGENASIEVDIDCAEKVEKIEWTIDGTAAADLNGKSKITYTNATADKSGSYVCTVTNRGCSKSTNDLQLTVKPFAKYDKIEENYELERGTRFTLNLVTEPANADINWTSTEGRNVANPIVIDPVMNDEIFLFEITANDYCPTEGIINIRVEGKPSLTASADKLSICKGDKITLTADTSGTGKLIYPELYSLSWIKTTPAGSEVVAKNKTTLTITPEKNAVYKALVEYKAVKFPAKIESDTLPVKVYAPATYTKTDAITVCERSNTEIGVSDLSPSDASVIWTSGETTPSITVSPEINGENKFKYYSFTVAQAGKCEQKDSILVKIEEPVEYSVEPEYEICEGDKAELQLTSISAPMKYEWSLNGEVVGNGHKITVTPRETSEYILAISGGACPVIEEEITVNVNSMPRIDTVLVTGIRKVLVKTSDGYGTEPFQFNVDKGDYTDENRFTLKTYGRHIYTVMDSKGCIGTMAHHLEAPAINIPNVFTPGSDGIDDVWEVPDIAETYPDAVITIYDRFGKKLVEMKGSDGGWDGTYNGHRMPSTDYWYEINIDEIDKVYIGHFTLISE